MINKDYILRLAEQIGRELSILLRLRQREKSEEALIAIDSLLLRTTGFASCAINLLSAETLVKVLSPLGHLQVESCLWMAAMLKAEGQIYEEQGNTNEASHRYLKSLHLFLITSQHEPIEDQSLFSDNIKELQIKLEKYPLPETMQELLSWYHRA